VTGGVRFPGFDEFVDDPHGRGQRLGEQFYNVLVFCDVAERQRALWRLTVYRTLDSSVEVGPEVGRLSPAEPQAYLAGLRLPCLVQPELVEVEPVGISRKHERTEWSTDKQGPFKAEQTHRGEVRVVDHAVLTEREVSHGA